MIARVATAGLYAMIRNSDNAGPRGVRSPDSQ